MASSSLYTNKVLALLGGFEAMVVSELIMNQALNEVSSAIDKLRSRENFTPKRARQLLDILQEQNSVQLSPEGQQDLSIIKQILIICKGLEVDHDELLGYLAEVKPNSFFDDHVQGNNIQITFESIKRKCVSKYDGLPDNLVLETLQSYAHLFTSDSGSNHPLVHSNFKNVLRKGDDLGVSINHSRYWVARSLRYIFHMHLSHHFVSVFQSTVDSINKLITDTVAQRVKKNESPQRFRCRLKPIDVLSTVFSHIDKQYTLSPYESPSSIPYSVLCLAFLVGTLRYEDGRIHVAGPALDAEYLLSIAFGNSTEIVGLDTLFGGGGILFSDAVSSGDSVQDSLPGRVVLIRGGNGCGKTLLSLSLGADIAQKGGITIFHALEYGNEVARFALSRAGYSSDDPRYEYVTKPSEFQYVAKDMSSGKGMFFLRTMSADQEEPIDYADLLGEIREGILSLPLKGSPVVVFIDSLNALTRSTVDRDSDEALPKSIRSDEHFRRKTLSLLHSLAKSGCNVVLTAEEDNSWAGFGEDIADTVIRLSSDGSDGQHDRNTLRRSHQGRYMSVRKSRLQREQRGYHPFRIIPGTGIEVYPSTAAFATIDRSRGLGQNYPGLFGVHDLDRVIAGKLESSVLPEDLATDEFDCGSVILLQGKLGTYKTQLGLSFISWYSNDNYVNTLKQGKESSNKKSNEEQDEIRRRSILNKVGLVISVRYSEEDIRSKIEQPICTETIRHMRKVAGISNATPHKSVWTCRLQPGYVYPGEIFTQIEHYFNLANEQGLVIDRVFLDNPGEWADACPLVRQDEIFGDTLVAFLRRRNVKILATNRMVSERDSDLIRAISESVDTWINLNHIDTDISKVASDTVSLDYSMSLQVERSPGMEHSRKLLGINKSISEGLGLSGDPIV